MDKDRLHRVAYLVALVGICQFSIFGFVAMLCYPGGTPFDPDTSGYCFWSNTLSDLGREVSISGRPNRTGALVFRASLAMATVLGGGIWLALPGMFRSRRRLGLAVRVAGGTYVAAMIGTATTGTGYFVSENIGAPITLNCESRTVNCESPYYLLREPCSLLKSV